MQLQFSACYCMLLAYYCGTSSFKVDDVEYAYVCHVPWCVLDMSDLDITCTCISRCDVLSKETLCIHVSAVNCVAFGRPPQRAAGVLRPLHFSFCAWV